MAPSIIRLARVALVCADLDAAEDFYVTAFDCSVRERRREDASFAVLLGVPEAQARQTILRLGDQEIALVGFDPPGRSYPPGGTSTDLWFQHFAIIVADMDRAYARLRDAGRFLPISVDGPQPLPPESGSVTAFKFRDADGHPLELLAFPAGAAPDAWAGGRGAGLFRGIDHSAISVADTRRSITFFEAAFGMRLAAQTENTGPAQARLDAVPGARVTVSGLVPRQTPPHLELLGYRVGARRPIADGTRSNDIAATHVVLETPDIASVVAALTAQGACFVSPGIVALADGSAAIMVLDPDGHRFVVTQPGSAN